MAVGCQKRLIFCDTTQLAAAQTPPDAAVWHHTSVLSHELGIVEQASICSSRFAYSKYGVSSMIAKVRFHKWLEGNPSPYEMEQSWDCTFLELFAHMNTK